MSKLRHETEELLDELETVLSQLFEAAPWYDRQTRNRLAALIARTRFVRLTWEPRWEELDPLLDKIDSFQDGGNRPLSGKD
jgi:hypothetical protein